MPISGSDFQKNKVHGFWECFVFLCFLCEQWCFSCSDVFLFYIDWSHLSMWHLRIRKENHTSPHEFQQNTLKFILIISANVNIHTLDHFWIYSMIFCEAPKTISDLYLNTLHKSVKYHWCCVTRAERRELF